MTSIQALPTAHTPQTDTENWTERIVYLVLMAVIVGLYWLLFAEIITFSASLDALTVRDPSEAFITVSRIGASLVMLLLAKEVAVALKAGMGLSRGAVTGGVERVDPATAPMVSVIVPAFNEGRAIEETMRALIALDYPRFEIVVVDDGSTDDTLIKARGFAASTTSVPVHVLTQPNTGKWKALNAGIAHARGALVLCVDADSYARSDVLQLMVPHFGRPEVAAVSGQVQVRNQVNLVTRLQALEYLVTNGSARMAQSESGCVLIVPGPLGLFRRTALEEVSRVYFRDGGSGTSECTGECAGPFSQHTFAEDFDLSVMICALGHKIVYEPRAISLTRAPESVRTLLSQRYRWLRGSMQVGSRFREDSKGIRNRALRWWMTISSAGELYLIPLAGVMLLGLLTWTAVVGDMKGLLALWLLVWALHACMAAMFIRSHGEKLSLCLLSPLQALYGVVLLTGVWMHAVIDHASSKPMRW